MASNGCWLVLLVLMLTLTQEAKATRNHRHRHGECLLQQARGEVKHLREYCEDYPEGVRVLSGIPITSLCQRDLDAIVNISGDPQSMIKKCCRRPGRIQCTDREWRTILLARYIRVLCDHMHC